MCICACVKTSKRDNKIKSYQDYGGSGGVVKGNKEFENFNDWLIIIIVRSL